MNKVIFAFLLSIVIGSQAYAQGYVSDLNGNPFTERNTADLGGSPYFNDEFLKGTITMEDKSVYKDLYLRYDQESDQLVYRKPNSSVSMLPNGKVFGFTIEQPNGIVTNFKYVFTNDGKADGFYQLLYDGSSSLLKKVKKKVVEVVEYNSPSKTKTLSTTTNYYILRSTGVVELIKADKKSFIKAFGNESDINDFIVKQKINLKNESDMIKLVAFIDSLKKSS